MENIELNNTLGLNTLSSTGTNKNLSLIHI